MQEAKWKRIQDAVAAARDHSGAKRVAIVDEWCGDDKELRAEVESLLACAGRTRDFLEPPDAGDVAAVLSGQQAEALVGCKIGGFEITAVLGYGGMGVVYRAQQDHTNREVALKVVRGGIYVGRRQVKLFEREARTLARLTHPSIAAVHEAGSTDDGRHYFAMELVDGVSLDEYVRTHGPSLPDKLSLFCRICDAINYAHQRGVIHRDVKPSNILIDDAGHPKVLDFGLAKITDTDVAVTTTATEVGKIQGTLAYMSPEQARGDSDDIDLRSDVYSLGVVLFQMLTDNLPYPIGRSVPDALRSILEAEPIRPRSFDRSIDDDVETVILKCLDKNPDRRYQSVGELARDVHHFLAGEPIEAKRDSVLYVVRKHLRRYRWRVGLAAAFVLLVTGGFLVSATFWRRAEGQRAAAVVEADRANTVVDVLQRMLASADQHMVKGQHYTVREMLDHFSNELGASLADQPEVEVKVRQVIVNAFSTVGKYERAENEHIAIIGLLQKLYGPRDPRAAKAIFERAWNLHEMRDFESAETWFRKALAIQLAVLGPEHIDTAGTLSGLADILCHLELYDEAETMARRALNIQQRELGDRHQIVSQTWVVLATIYDGRGDHAEAEQAARNGIASCAGLADEHPGKLIAQFQLARALVGRNKHSEAGPILEHLLTMYRIAYPEEHRRVTLTKSFLGECRTVEGRYEEAEKLLVESHVAIEKMSENKHVLDASVRRLANLYEASGKPDLAAQYRSRIAPDPIDAQPAVVAP